MKRGMTAFWTGRRVRLRGIEPDDWAAFQRFATEEEGSGDLPHPPGSAEHYQAWTKEQATAAPDGDRVPLVIEAVGTGEAVGALAARHAVPNPR